MRVERSLPTCRHLPRCFQVLQELSEVPTEGRIIQAFKSHGWLDSGRKDFTSQVDLEEQLKNYGFTDTNLTCDE